MQPVTCSSGVSNPYTTQAYYLIDNVSLYPISAGPELTVVCGQPGSQPLGACALPTTSGATYSWFPSTGLSNPNVANPTITSLGATTTYQLTVTIDGTEYKDDVTVTVVPPAGGSCPCTHDYGQNVAATYQPTLHGPGNRVYELGAYNTLTEIDAQLYPNNTVVFDGSYYIKGPIAFLGGKFELRPGTIFYFETESDYRFASSCYGRLSYNEYGVRLYVGKGAELTLEKATLTSVCDKMWGGVQLAYDAVLRSYGNSVIRDAYVGVMTGEYCQDGVDTHYFITDTEFFNCHYGFVELGKHTVLPEEGISRSLFHSDPATMLQPYAGQFTLAGLAVDGPNLAGLVLADNTFDTLAEGAEVFGNGADLHDNTFTRCYALGISAGTFLGNGQYDRYVTIRNNTVSVPDDPTMQTPNQILTGADVVGIQVLSQPAKHVLVGGNTINGGAAPKTSKNQIGIQVFALGNASVKDVNGIRNLDVGILLKDVSNQFYTELTAADNRLVSNTTGIQLTGDLLAYTTAIVECNTIDNTTLSGSSKGIFFDAQSRAVALGSSQFPNGNRFPGFSATNSKQAVVNDSQFGPIDYYVFNPQPATENVSQIVNSSNIANSNIGSVVLANSGAYLCSTRQRGPYTQGANRTTSPSPADVADWMQRLQLRQGTRAELLVLERRLITYFHDAAQPQPLEAFVNTLPLFNAEAFQRLSLYLMAAYRGADQEPDAQRVRQQLLVYAGQDPNVTASVAYADVLYRATRSAARLVPADSATLARLATTPGGHADVACATLRRFYPGSPCGGTALRSGTAAAANSATNPAPRQARLETAYPNPATDLMTVPYALPEGHATGTMALYDLRTGRQVAAVQLKTVTGHATLSVAHLPMGFYACKLEVAGRPLLTHKVSVLH